MKKLLKCFIFLMFSKAIIASYGMENVVDAEIKDANVWKKVPIEKIEEITNFLPFRDYRTLQVTSKQFNNILHGYGQIITFEDFKSKNNLAEKIIRRLELNYLASGVDFSAIAEELTNEIFTTKVRSRVHCPDGKIEEGYFEITFLFALMPNLSSLDFTGCKHINRESFFGLFCSLQHLNKITYLKLSHCTKLDSDRIFPMKKLTNLQELYLDHTSINLINGAINPCCPNSLSYLVNLKKLETLDLSGCIGICDLTPLMDLTSLKILKIGCGNGKPLFGFARLQEKLPKLKFPGMSS